ncbi:Serine protease inhibitor 42Dd [Pseudolycoriella hygida]|uniref:Serine protease inhibitor 42Dd n=1 Tax=Pseudolycoriella hygida TaxID=35572 RepID=A0A9Q0MZF2_9DIPT|nr:Serine protease inhibitor 42Dd [Pseudolycoriella hygida]
MTLLKYIISLFLFIFAVNASPVEVRDVSNRISLFANDLYSQCVKVKPGNVIISPLSVVTLLALLYEGTSGETSEQLKTALHLDNDKPTVADQFLAHREALQSSLGESTLSIANRVYFKEGYQLVKNFQDVAAAKYKSGAEPLNFIDSERSVATVNQFVETETNGKIRDLYEKDAFDADTRVVLVNAIYFKGNWKSTFFKRSTGKRDFYNSGTEKVSVDFMYNDDDFDSAYIKDLGATVLEMKYNNSKTSFVIVLPDERSGLPALEAKLKDYNLNKLTENLRSNRFEVHIPKFKIDYEIKLNDVLKNLGMTHMFNPSNDFNGLLETEEKLLVSDVVHKAFIEIDEKGSEAAAATAARMIAYSAPPVFFADHPFMFFLRDTETNTMIFSGRIEKL